ncbi:hypothetical protein B0H14DRAFT_2559623 [Mycena olivaceomarginata]|nr:hypothetical protein B0H14DRAFT_2559623 [Mycena olivaceomarginata]
MEGARDAKGTQSENGGQEDGWHRESMEQGVGNGEIVRSNYETSQHGYTPTRREVQLDLKSPVNRGVSGLMPSAEAASFCNKVVSPTINLLRVSTNFSMVNTELALLRGLSGYVVAVDGQSELLNWLESSQAIFNSTINPNSLQQPRLFAPRPSPPSVGWVRRPPAAIASVSSDPSRIMWTRIDVLCPGDATKQNLCTTSALNFHGHSTDLLAPPCRICEYYIPNGKSVWTTRYKGGQRAAHRLELEREAELKRAAEMESETSPESAPGHRIRSPSPSYLSTAKKRHIAFCPTCTDEIGIELLHLECNDMEGERDNLRQECNQLKHENVKLKAELDQYKWSLTFFQKETGRWRWAAANAHPRMDTAMQEFRDAMRAASQVLKNPAKDE